MWRDESTTGRDGWGMRLDERLARLEEPDGFFDNWKDVPGGMDGSPASSRRSPVLFLCFGSGVGTYEKIVLACMRLEQAGGPRP